MASWWGRIRDYFGDDDSRESVPDASGGYWNDPELESVFDIVDPAVRYGFSEEFTPSDERRGRDLFYEGFVSERISPDDRSEAREQFLDWMSEFDMMDAEADFWDSWREWYKEAG